MKLSRSSIYAIQVMLHLARSAPGVPVSSTRLARAGHMPDRYLLQILQRLVAHKVLHSTRGAAGGYVLARPSGQITLLHILDAIENPPDSKLSGLRGLGVEAKAQLHKTLNDASEVANAKLRKLTIADLAGRTNRRSRRR